MTTDEQLHQKAARLHQRERMRAWTAFRSACGPCDLADKALAEFDKRFPAPVAPAAIRDTRLRADIPATELAALREKARYWDAMWPVWYGQEDDAIHAARKVIDAGALK